MKFEIKTDDVLKISAENLQLIEKKVNEAILNSYPVVTNVMNIEEAKKSATPAPDQWYGTIDKAVEYLQECKRKGQNVYIEFNGNILYSADVTLDRAYLQITGLTKEESDKAEEELSGTRTIKDGKFYTDEEKVKAIYKWMIYNFEYDYDCDPLI